MALLFGFMAYFSDSTPLIPTNSITTTKTDVKVFFEQTVPLKIRTCFPYRGFCFGKSPVHLFVEERKNGDKNTAWYLSGIPTS